MVATALTKNAAEGRLTLEELEERLGTAYAAKTYGDLSSLLTDLPSGTAPMVLAGDRLPEGTGPGGRGRRQRHGHRHRRGWSSYTTVNALCWAIWGVAVATSHHHGLDGLWPLWVTVPWGVLRVSHRVSHAGARETTS
jgi:hypothetical protein